jgi:hypothetical protein
VRLAVQPTLRTDSADSPGNPDVPLLLGRASLQT